ncbi:MAG: S1 family peptidase [Bacteriovoracaceae bacterium]
MKKKLIRKASFFLLLLSNFSANAAVKIVGGQKVLDTDPISRFTVAVKLSGTKHCSGTLIRPRIILFAAHCTWKSSSYAVQFGSKPEGSQLIKGIGVIILKNNTLGEGDLALLVLEKEAPKEFRPIEIGITNSEVTMIAAGFGKSTPGYGSTQERVLQKIELPVVSIGPTIRLRNRIYEKDNQFGINGGDSGGPVLIKNNQDYKVVGVHSQLIGLKTDIECCASDHVNLETHLDWICEKIEAIESGFKDNSSTIPPTACSSHRLKS